MGMQSKLATPAPAARGVMEILFGSRKRSLGLSAILVSSAIYVVLTRQWASKSNKPDLLQIKKEDGAAKQKVAVDGVFFTRLWRLLKILIPGPLTPESGYLLLVAAMMLSRTWCDVWMLKNGTAIERTIITRDFNGFLVVFINFMMALFPIALVNNLLRYGLNELALRFRARLTNHLYQEYLNGFTYYKVSNLDNRIANADQLLTQDVEKFCTSVSELYSNVSKPILDIFIYARRLSGAIGAQGPMSMLAYLLVSGLLLTRLRRPIGKFTVNEQRLEGEFRFVNSRLITHSEEVAFYGGNEKEREVINRSFRGLVSHLRYSIQFRALLGIIDSIIAKYCASSVGWLVVSRPFFDLNNPKLRNASQAELMEYYYKSGRMLMNMALAVGRLVLAGRELTRLAGYTARVTELQAVLKDLNSGKYQRTMVNKNTGSTVSTRDLKPNTGKIITQDHIIKFEDVPIVTPNGDLLIESLNFEVRSGMNVLVAGPNGCGKSSLFRILGELWPLFGGTLTKPAKNKLFYVPQRPYLALGTLRDQVIYPHSKQQLVRDNVTDDDLMEYLRQVQLDYLVEREGGWDAVSDWADVLSGGEKQRVAMARLFYHKPQFAILDECTSAVSVDVEGYIYTKCRELGITLFTVSHRRSLWAYHEYVLQFSGRGQYTFQEIKSDQKQFGS
jgi:ATP-binding cassette subfamily D (ALD) protein 3